MKTYHVTWTIEVDAETPLEAAREAKKIQLDKDSIANNFDVVQKEFEGRELFEIDLNIGDGEGVR